MPWKIFSFFAVSCGQLFDIQLRDDTFMRKMEAEREQAVQASQGGKKKPLNKSLAAIDEQYSANDGYADLMNSTRPKNAVSGSAGD